MTRLHNGVKGFNPQQVTAVTAYVEKWDLCNEEITDLVMLVRECIQLERLNDDKTETSPEKQQEPKPQRVPGD